MNLLWQTSQHSLQPLDWKGITLFLQQQLLQYTSAHSSHCTGFLISSPQFWQRSEMFFFFSLSYTGVANREYMSTSIVRYLLWKTGDHSTLCLQGCYRRLFLAPQPYPAHHCPVAGCSCSAPRSFRKSLTTRIHTFVLGLEANGVVQLIHQ